MQICEIIFRFISRFSYTPWRRFGSASWVSRIPLHLIIYKVYYSVIFIFYLLTTKKYCFCGAKIQRIFDIREVLIISCWRHTQEIGEKKIARRILSGKTDEAAGM